MLRVLHAPVNVGNQPWVLSRQERLLGLHSDLVVNNGSWLDYDADRFLNKTPPVSTYAKFWAKIRESWFGLLAPLRYDVLHFYFGRSFFNWASDREWFGGFFDVKLARRLGRKIFMTLQGCDARLSDENSARNDITMCHLGRCQYAAECRKTHDRRRRRLITKFLPLFDRVFILNPDLAHDVPGATFLPYANVDVDKCQPIYPRTEGPIRLLHAPSNASIKGTQYIVDAVATLKQRWPIELMLVQGMPHAEAVKLYTKADLVVDQLLAGWYGGFAVEMMALGKPVAGYVRESDMGHVPTNMRSEIPLLRLTPTTLVHDLENLFKNRHHWVEWGQRSRQFVMRWHHPGRIALAMERAYREPGSPFSVDTIPESTLRQAA